MSVSPEFDNNISEADATAAGEDADLDARIDAMFAASSFGDPESVRVAEIGARAMARRAARWPKPCEPISPTGGDFGQDTNTAIKNFQGRRGPAPEGSDLEPSPVVVPDELRRQRDLLQRQMSPAKRKKNFADIVLYLLVNGANRSLVNVLLDGLEVSETEVLAAHQLAVLLRQGGETDLAEALIAYGQDRLPRTRLAMLRGVQVRVGRKQEVFPRAEADVLFFAACSRHVRGDFVEALRLYRAARSGGLELARAGIEALTVQNPANHSSSSIPEVGSLWTGVAAMAAAYTSVMLPGSIVGPALPMISPSMLRALGSGVAKAWQVRRANVSKWQRATDGETKHPSSQLLFGDFVSSVEISVESPTEKPLGLIGRASRDLACARAAFVAPEAVEYLVDLASEGRGSGVDQLVQLAFPVVTRYCESRLLDLPVAETTIDDVAVTVFGEVVQSLPRARATKQDFVSLVYEKCLESVEETRTRFGEEERSGPWVTFWDDAITPASGCSIRREGGVSPDRLAVGLMNHLPPMEREVLVLAFVGLSPEQAARATNIHLSRIRAVQYRGLQGLRAMIARGAQAGGGCSVLEDRHVIDQIDEGVTETLRRVWSSQHGF